MDEKEIEEIIEENKWLKVDTKLSSLMFTGIVAILGCFSLQTLNIFARVGADTALKMYSENPFATAFVQCCFGVSTLVLFAIICLWTIERICNTYKEEIIKLCEDLKKYKLVKEEERKV